MAKAKKLPSGNWNIKVYSHSETIDGVEHRRYESFTDPSKSEVEYQAAEFARDKKRKAKPTNWTVGEAIDGYIKSKDGVLSPTTIEGYKKIRETNFIDLMDVKLCNLNNEIIQNEINKESKRISLRTKKKISSKTIANAHGLLSSALNMYYPEFVLKTTLPSKEAKIVELPSADEIIFAIQGSDIELPCLLALWLSYSMSEIRGIKASSISPDGYIKIERVIVDVDGKPMEKTKTKTFARTRRAKIPEYIFNQIKENENYKKYCDSKEDGYLIDLSGKGIYNRFLTIQNRHNLPHTRFHDLRHMNASVMLKLGVPDKYAMERGGWSTTHTLKKVYQHTISDERAAVDKRIDDYFDSIVQHEMQHNED